MTQSSEYYQALNRIAAAVEAEAPHIAPRVGAAGDIDYDAALPDNTRLVEWVIVSSWADLDSGITFFDVDAAPNMLRTHVLGLLLKALDHQRQA